LSLARNLGGLTASRWPHCLVPNIAGGPVELLLEAGGEVALIGKPVAPREVRDTEKIETRILEFLATLVEATKAQSIAHRTFDIGERLLQISQRDTNGVGDLLGIEVRIAEVIVDIGQRLPPNHIPRDGGTVRIVTRRTAERETDNIQQLGR
jgi:hypothetical protein